MLGAALLSPLGLGLVGAALQYRLSPALLGVGSFLVVLSSAMCVPGCVNYAVECFTDRAVAVGVAFAVWRQMMAVGWLFAAAPWEARVGPGWVFGTVAAVSVGMTLGVAGMVWRGAEVRRGAWMRGAWRVVSESGETVI